MPSMDLDSDTCRVAPDDSDTAIFSRMDKGNAGGHHIDIATMFVNNHFENAFVLWAVGCGLTPRGAPRGLHMQRLRVGDNVITPSSVLDDAEQAYEVVKVRECVI